MSDLLQVGALIAVPVVVTVAAAALSVRATPGPKLMSAVQHFAAGVVLAAVAGEVLPALREEGHLPWAVLGFGLGIVLVVTLEMIGQREAAKEGHQAGGLEGVSPSEASARGAARVPSRSACSSPSPSTCSWTASSSAWAPRSASPRRSS